MFHLMTKRSKRNAKFQQGFIEYIYIYYSKTQYVCVYVSES